MVITENKINGLSFPAVSGAMVIFGLGYGVDALADVPWLRKRTIHYWGDIDTHGFAILSRLRGHLPQVRSLMMDEATLLACRELWVQEESNKRFTGEPGHLTEAERALYHTLRDDRFGHGVRLEQERILFDRVIAVVDALEAD